MLVPLTLVGGVTHASARDGELVAADQESAQQTEAQKALETASSTGERVEVESERSETTTVYANPDGSTFTLEESAVPVRVKDQDGGWQAPDATLIRRADGMIVPRAAAVAMEFSRGGRRMIRWSGSRRTASLSPSAGPVSFPSRNWMVRVRSTERY